MSSISRRPLLRVAAATLCSFALLTASALAQDSEAPADDPGVIGDSGTSETPQPVGDGRIEALLDDPAVAFLADEQGISREEALGRLEDQILAEDLNVEWTQSHPDAYAGAWLAPNGGVGLTIAATSGQVLGELRAQAARAGIANVSTVLADHSIEELTEAYETIADDIVGLNERGSTTEAAMEVSIDVAQNTVVLTHEAEQPLTADQELIIDEAEDAPDSLIEVNNHLVHESQGEACNTSSLPAGCDPPLRGGTHIRHIDGAISRCTGGFVVSSRTTPANRYLLTAGHCFDTNIGGREGRLVSGYAAIGAPHRGSENRWFTSGTDSAMVTINTNAYWKSRGWVFVRASTDPQAGHGTNEDQDYVISGTGFAMKDSVVCFSGAVSGTDCGFVTNPETTGSFETAFGPYNYSNATQTRQICTQTGDSGAPYYKLGRAYGTHISGPLSGCDGAKYTHIADAVNLNNVNVVLN